MGLGLVGVTEQPASKMRLQACSRGLAEAPKPGMAQATGR